MISDQLTIARAAALVEPPPTAATDAAEASWPASGDARFWRKSAPAAARRRYAKGKLDDGWRVWRRHLLDRARPLPLVIIGHRRKSLPTAVELLVAEASGAATPKWLIGLLAGDGAENDGIMPLASADVSRWLAATEDGVQSWRPAAEEVWEAIAWSYALLPLVKILPGPLWWGLLERLHRLAEGATLSLEEEPLANQLACGELAWTLAWQFPELGPCVRLAQPARKALSLGIAELLDGDGLPQSAYISDFPRLLASWTRCRMLATHRSSRATAHNCWDDDAEQQFPLAIRELLRLGRRDGSAPFESAATGDFDLQRLAETAIRLSDNKKARRTIGDLLAARDGQRRKHPARLPRPTVHSEWAEMAVLQSDWSADGLKLTVAYGEPGLRIELESGRRLIFSGPWGLDVSLDGVPAEPLGKWEEVCWETDAECDYLELEIELAGARVQRQMLLSRQDEFLYMADAVLGARAGELAYRGRLSLAPGVTVEAADETRELTLAGNKQRMHILPLALPEWRTDPRGGALSVNGPAAELRQSRRAERLYAPLWIDLSPKRAKQPLTWRQLSVGQDRQNLPPDVAAGFRVQFGKRQWLVYRSLTPPANRTILGVNLSTEFVLARFGRDGEIETVLEIE